MNIQYDNLTPFGWWLASWVPVFERIRQYDRQYGWKIRRNLRKRAFTGFNARPDYWVFGGRVLFPGWRMAFWLGRVRFVWFRPRRKIAG